MTEENSDTDIPEEERELVDVRTYNNDLKVTQIESVMETLDDKNMLNSKGVSFRHEFWEKYLKDTEESSELSQGRDSPETVAWECKDNAGYWISNWDEDKEDVKRRGQFKTESSEMNPLIRLSSHKRRMKEQLRNRKEECDYCGNRFLIPTGFMATNVCPDCWIKKGKKQQREEVIEMLEEDGELYEIILERFKEAEDVDDTIWYNKFGTLFDVIIQDLKQKLKGEDEARENE